MREGKPRKNRCHGRYGHSILETQPREKEVVVSIGMMREVQITTSSAHFQEKPDGQGFLDLPFSIGCPCKLQSSGSTGNREGMLKEEQHIDILWKKEETLARMKSCGDEILEAAIFASSWQATAIPSHRGPVWADRAAGEPPRQATASRGRVRSPA